MFVRRDDIHIVSGDVQYTISNYPFPLNGILIISRWLFETYRVLCTGDDMYIVSTTVINCIRVLERLFIAVERGSKHTKRPVCSSLQLSFHAVLIVVHVLIVLMGVTAFEPLPF